MREPKGVVFPLSVPRRLIADLLHFANRVPSIPLSRLMDVSSLIAARRSHPARPSWSVIFMKAYAQVAIEHPPLRRALLEWPLERIYEHPQTNCSLAIERSFEGAIETARIAANVGNSPAGDGQFGQKAQR